MSKFLSLMRHAQSADKQAGQTDKMRELTSQGSQQATLIGNFLSNQENIPEIIICSTALRAKQTAIQLAHFIGIKADRIQFENDIYKLTLSSFVQIVNAVDKSLNHILVIGHNPMITYLAEHLSSERIAEMTPGSLVTIQFDTANWTEVGNNSGRIVQDISPETI